MPEKKKYANESALSSAIIADLNKMDGVFCQKLHGSAFGSAGLDIFGHINGKLFWLEVKQPKKQPTPRQYAIMQKWIRSGAIATWTDSLDCARKFVNKVLRDGNAGDEETQLKGYL